MRTSISKVMCVVRRLSSKPRFLSGCAVSLELNLTRPSLHPTRHISIQSNGGSGFQNSDSQIKYMALSKVQSFGRQVAAQVTHSMLVQQHADCVLRVTSRPYSAYRQEA